MQTELSNFTGFPADSDCDSGGYSKWKKYVTLMSKYEKMCES